MTENLESITILSSKNLVLELCGIVDPENIDSYISHGGYEGLKIALHMPPEEVIERIKSSGLRGRGGAGFPTGLKWEFCRKALGLEKFVIINADEGDPGAFMDRALLELNPHSVLEGLIIGAYAIGANSGIIYVRAEYPLALKRFAQTIVQANLYGFLGDHILGSNFNLQVTLHKGAGAFVCGEETALIASIEGHRGQPRHKPPFPTTTGLWQKPTNINNVKTWATVPWILKNGPERFKEYGTTDSSGTVIFSLAGKIKHGGLIEVPMGTSLREIIFKYGGGILNDERIKAVQTGGPSGGCIPESLLDTPVDYGNMSRIGSIMGSGGMIVIDTSTCIVNFAKYFLSFTQSESCGKCIPCREGTFRGLEILERITKGNGKVSDLEELENLSQIIKTTSLCGLGQTAPNPLLSTLKYFKPEYLQHIVEKKCIAGQCPALFKFYIDEELCNDCSRCQKNCSFNAISGDKSIGFYIHDEVCEGCRACFEVCPKKAIKIGWN